MKKRIVLVGGGHAHPFVLEALARELHADIEVVLISPAPLQYYSGMLPGWMAGHYTLPQCRIDLMPLLTAARVAFIQDTVVGMDADKRCVCLSDGRHVPYDILSLDVGSETQLAWLMDLGDKLISVKPLQSFAQAWQTTLDMAGRATAFHLAVVGGGAAGVELALSAARALHSVNPASHVSLIAGEQGVLRGHARTVVKLAEAMLAKAGVALVNVRAVGTPSGLLLSNGQSLEADKVVAATGARAAVWLQAGKLQLDARGFIAVNGHHQSLSHANVFAAGDVCTRSDVTMSRSGVSAVKVGPILAHNLLAMTRGQALKTYHPRRHALYLLADGEQQAIMSWGPLAASGGWIWRWKDAIDRRFMTRFGIRAKVSPKPHPDDAP
jgi:pyridine nucleotide-disulfide oxidoreductase family protein